MSWKPDNQVSGQSNTKEKENEHENLDGTNIARPTRQHRS